MRVNFGRKPSEGLVLLSKDFSATSAMAKIET